MAYPRRLAEAFAKALSDALDGGVGNDLLWESATRRAGLDGGEVRVLSENGVLYLVGQEWVVYPDDGWKVRPFEGEDDPLYDSAVEMHALDDTEE